MVFSALPGLSRDKSLPLNNYISVSDCYYLGDMIPLLSANVLWSFDREVLETDFSHQVGALFSGIKPFHRHAGNIILFEDKIIILGDLEIEIPLGNIDQIYLGFDDVFLPSLAKNLGLTWQPLRLTLADGQRFYLIMDYKLGGTKNQLWFNGLQELLSGN